MITAIRRSFKTRAYKIVLWIALLAVGGVFSLFELGKTFFFGKSSGGNWIVQVNKSTITVPEFMRSVADHQERIRLMRQQYGQYADLYFQMMGMSLNPEELALSALIRRALLNGLANQLPLYISEDMAQSMLNDPMVITQELSDLVPLFAWDPSLNGINPLVLHSYLRQVGVSASEFNHELAQAVKRTDVKNLVDHAIYIPEFALKDQFAHAYLGHKFTFGTISAADALAQAKKEAVSNEALKAYYDRVNTRERKYHVPEKRSAQVITFNPEQYGISISDEQAQSYYNNNKAQFVEAPAQVQVRRILLKVESPDKEQQVKQEAEKIHADLIKDPQSFAQVAKELSQDSATAAQGGLMPYFAKGKHDKTFEKTSFLLKEGGISDVIRTPEGFEIVQQVGKKAQTFKPFASVSKDIKDTLRNKKFAEQFATDVRGLINQADHAKALEAFAQQKNGKVTQSKDITTADNSVLAKTLFRLKKGESSYYQDHTNGVVVTATDIKESYVPALADIKSTVLEDYYKDQGQKIVAAKLEKIAKEGLPKDTNGVHIEKTGWLRHAHEYKDDAAEKQALTKKGFNLGKAFQIENIGGLITYENNGEGFIIRLDEIAPFDQTLFETKKKDIRTELERQTEAVMMTSVVASLYRNAKINKNESLIRKES